MGHPALDGNFSPLPVHLYGLPATVSYNFRFFQLIHKIFSGIGLFESDTALHDSYWMLLVLYQFHIPICYRLWNR